jgi:hypothetical protein
MFLKCSDDEKRLSGINLFRQVMENAGVVCRELRSGSFDEKSHHEKADSVFVLMSAALAVLEEFKKSVDYNDDRDDRRTLSKSCAEFWSVAFELDHLSWPKMVSTMGKVELNTAITSRLCSVAATEVASGRLSKTLIPLPDSSLFEDSFKVYVSNVKGELLVAVPNVKFTIQSCIQSVLTGRDKRH